MPQRQTLIAQAEKAFQDHGWSAAVTVVVGGALALTAATVRKAFTNEAAVKSILMHLDARDARWEQEHKDMKDQLTRLNKRIDGLTDRNYRKDHE